MGTQLGPCSKKQEMILQSQARVLIAGGSAGCVDKDTEFLSQNGWKKISQYEYGDLVLQYDLNTRTANLTKPIEYIKKKSDGFYKIKTDRGLDQLLSKEHTVIYETSKGNLNKKSAEYFIDLHNKSKLGNTGKILTTYNFRGVALNLNESRIRLHVALKVDGHIATESTGRYIVRLKKERKVDRLKKLLCNSNTDYEIKFEESTGFYIFSLYQKDCSKLLSDWMFCSREDAEIIIDEIKYWDSHYNVSGNRIPSFSTVNKLDADAVQYFYNICGYKASIYYDIRDKYKNGICYQVIPTIQTKLNLNRKPGNKINIPFIKYGEYKYCFTVPTGALVLRRNGNVFITGNSGKSFLLLMMILQYIDCPNWRGVIFRRTTTEIKGQGGLFDEGTQLYSSLPIKYRPKINSSNLTFTFPSGAVLKLSHMEHVKHRLHHHGAQYTFIGWDELCTFEEIQFFYLMSRLRSKSKYPTRVFAT